MVSLIRRSSAAASAVASDIAITKAINEARETPYQEGIAYGNSRWRDSVWSPGCALQVMSSDNKSSDSSATGGQHTKHSRRKRGKLAPT